MDLNEQLQADGWILPPDGLKTLTEDGKLVNKQDVIKKALNTDIRDVGGCGFPAELSKAKSETFNGPIVVQVVKIRNISAPKANEESQAAPRMLKLILTDGTQVLPAIEITPISHVNLNTPPGTKLLLKGEIILSCGFLQLNTDQVQMLGGIVTNLVEKWTVSRNLAKHTRGRYGIEGGPPPWIPFGEKMGPTNLTDKNFKSLDDGSKENKDNDEFEAQRRDAIAEAGKTVVKKVFGGGTKPLMDKNVQAIMEKGFTLQEAEGALRQNRNNVDRALKSLTKRTGRGNENKGDKEKEGGGGGGVGGGRGGRRKGDDESGPKPSGRICLFEYLEKELTFLPEKEKSDKYFEKKDWEGGNFSNYKGSGSGANDYHGSGGGRHNRNTRDSGAGYQDRPSKWSGGGSSGRGGGSGGHSREFNNTERKMKTDDHHGKDGRNQRWQNSNHNQKPPRFQNQNRRIEPQTSEHFDHFITQSSDRMGSTGSSRSRNAEGYFQSSMTAKTNSNTGQHGNQHAGQHGNQHVASNRHSTNSQSFNGYRHSHTVDNSVQFSIPQSGSGSDHRNQNNSSIYKSTGFPDIPEFPFKDNASYSPIVSQPNACVPDIPAFPFKDSASFKPMAQPNNSHQANNNRNSGGTGQLGKPDRYRWNKGDKCHAKYWEDNNFYEAEVTGVSQNTCVVRFLNYGNFEEVLQDDCVPVTEDLSFPINSFAQDHNSNFNANKRSNNHFSGVLEFRRGGNRPYVKLDGSGPRKNPPQHRQPQQVYMPPPGRNQPPARGQPPAK
ncbi:DUF1767 [Nesidiocoris tenuis]|uniref:Survival of motor neuron-related-splicing factor 30 n=1 Tax=Nesidiocoris tenuis TaxID=355587 RepID=A0ABN7B701_9HEMI|nr:DUF1767 [Nesidiocoris tenuis]